jgi:hypothetical protein
MVTGARREPAAAGGCARPTPPENNAAPAETVAARKSRLDAFMIPPRTSRRRCNPLAER